MPSAVADWYSVIDRMHFAGIADCHVPSRTSTQVKVLRQFNIHSHLVSRNWPFSENMVGLDLRLEYPARQVINNSARQLVV